MWSAVSLALCCAIAWPSACFVTAAEVTGRVIDAETSAPVGARLYLQGEDGTWYFPASDAEDGSALPYKKQMTPTSLEMHTTLSPHPFRVDLAPGTYQLRVERGKEYVPHEQKLMMGSEPVAIEIPLRRWIHMAARGWYSGDGHVHRTLAEMPNLVLAEDLNVALPMTHWVTEAHTDPRRGNRVSDPSPDPRPIPVDATHLIYPLNTEYEIFTVGGKRHTLGAVLILGQNKPFDAGVPPVIPIAEQAHAQGALLDLEKHSWPWSAIIAPVMQVDLYELANNHCWPSEFAFHQWTIDMQGEYMNLETDEKGFTEWGWIDFGFKTYYALLNCGLRIQPTAGTANGVHPVPAGFGRVYVHLDEPLTFDGWLAALRSGNSFVTTGPMLDVTVNQQPGGAVIRSASPLSVSIRGTAESLAPLDRIEIIHNGQVISSLEPANLNRSPAGTTSSFNYSADIDETGWFAVRVFERHPAGRIRFAHSSPVHIEIGNQPIRPRRVELEYFIDRVQHELQRNAGVLSEIALQEQRQALEFYQALLPRAR